MGFDVWLQQAEEKCQGCPFSSIPLGFGCFISAAQELCTPNCCFLLLINQTHGFLAWNLVGFFFFPFLSVLLQAGLKASLMQNNAFNCNFTYEFGLWFCLPVQDYLLLLYSFASAGCVQLCHCTSISQLPCFPGIPLILQGLPAPLPPKPITPCAYSQLGICPGSHLLPCAYAPCHPNAPPAILTPLKHTNSIFSYSQTASFSPQTPTF